VVFGSIAFWLGQKADESATHRWTLYVRGPNGENLSYFVSKVVFFLHESFAQSVRTVTGTLKLICKHMFVVLFIFQLLVLDLPRVNNFQHSEPPFEVTEAGWGEFDTRIRLYFKDPQQDPVEIVYPLKLYPANNAQPVVKKPVVYEIYDEVW
jgi:YEATS domain-containing protein 4